MSTESIEIVISNSELDIALAAALGEKASDFLVLYANEDVLEGYGTPYDTPANRRSLEAFVEKLNSPVPNKFWREFFTNWRPTFMRQFKLADEITSIDFHPRFALKVHRTGVGYSEHFHCSPQLIERAGANRWSLGREGGVFFAEMDGLRNEGAKPATVVAELVLRYLQAK